MRSEGVMLASVAIVGLWLLGAGTRPVWSQAPAPPPPPPSPFKIQIMTSDLQNAENVPAARLEKGTASLTMAERDGRLFGTLTQGERTYRDVPFTLEGCGRARPGQARMRRLLVAFAGASAAVEADKDRDDSPLVEIRVRHPRSADCFLVGNLAIGAGERRTGR
jgi:hypothetical protein